MSEISVITRCRNRLEYTIQTVQCVQKTDYPDFQHIIIDNASTDGTHEWFKWMNKNTEALKNINYLRFGENMGDWGGMLAARAFIKDDCKYVVQLDNDILVPPGWLSALRFVLDNSKYKVVMLRRQNVLWKLPALEKPKMILDYEVAKVERPVACFMMSREFYGLCCDKIPPSRGMRSKYIIRSLAGNMIGKIFNVTCQEIDSLTQRKLYNPKNPQVWEKI